MHLLCLQLSSCMQGYTVSLNAVASFAMASGSNDALRALDYERNK